MSPELERIRWEMQFATRGLSGEDWLRSRPGEWSSALIGEHLLLSYLSTTLGLLKAIHSGKPSTSTATLRDRVATFMVAGIGFFPPGRSAPEQAIPKGRLPPNSLQKINNALTVMDARLADAEKRFGSRVKVLDHPGIGPLTAQEWRRFHRAHGLHHINQINKQGKGRG